LEKIKASDYTIDDCEINNFCFFIFFGDAISISRDISYSNNNIEGFENYSIAFKEQRFIRIVRNEGERGITIKIKGRKNATPFKEKDREINIPLVD